MRKNILATAIAVGLATVLIPGSSLAGFLKPRKPASGGGGSSAAQTPAQTSAQTPSATAPEPVASKGTSPDAQISPGSYDVVTLGTDGGHRKNPGSTGVITIGSAGQLSGSLYHYDDGTLDTISGTINLSTGQGTVNTANESYAISAKTTTKSYTYLESSYSKKGSDSKGKLWGIRSNQ